MNTVVFSDVHLDVRERGGESMESLVAFLRGIDPGRVERVVVLGDLFDFWFEYKHVVFSGYFDVLRAFADLRDRGVELHFVCGNHDLWAGRFLSDGLGFVIHKGPVVLDCAGQRVLFAHGDGLNRRDARYRAYKRIACMKVVQWLFRLLHPDWAMALAQRVSRTSRGLLSSGDVCKGAEVSVLRGYAEKALSEGTADVVMCGHSHHPVREEFRTPDGPGLYINTGDWMCHRAYVEWDGAGFRLKQFGPVPGEQIAACETEDAVEQQQRKP